MINARLAIIRQVNDLFSLRLRGVLSWADVEVLDPVPALLKPGERKSRYEKYAEIVSIVFGVYEIHAYSPSERQPIGRIEFRRGIEPLIEGPLDDATWARVADRIKEVQNEHSTSSDRPGSNWTDARLREWADGRRAAPV